MFFFSAIPRHRNERKQERHRLFYAVQENVCKVKVVDGRFGKKDVKVSCKYCKRDFSYVKYEEKETDVALGMQVVHDVNTKALEKIIIVSGDTDFVPIINYVLRKTNVKVKVLVPMNHKAFRYSEHLKSKSIICGLKQDKHKNYTISPLKEQHIQKSKLDDVLDCNGHTYTSPYI